jgi:hypothetical protein
MTAISDLSGLSGLSGLSSLSGLFFLILLVFSHMLADFVLQPNRWVDGKYEDGWRSRYLYLHVCVVALLAGSVAWAFLGLFPAALVFASFFLSHLAIDMVKSRCEDTARSFVGAQAAHMIIIILVWITLYHPDFASLQGRLSEPTLICITVVLLSYTLIFQPAGIFVSKMTRGWRDKIQEDDKNKGRESGSLESAGRYIGYLERFLILTFIIFQQYTAIGLLIAAKSIFRYNTNRITGEYILFGTLLSFSIAIFVGFFANLFLSLFLPDEVWYILNTFIYNPAALP